MTADYDFRNHACETGSKHGRLNQEGSSHENLQRAHPDIPTFAVRIFRPDAKHNGVAP